MAATALATPPVTSNADAIPAGNLQTVRDLVATLLAPKVLDVDIKAEYPEAFLRALEGSQQFGDANQLFFHRRVSARGRRGVLGKEHPQRQLRELVRIGPQMRRQLVPLAAFDQRLHEMVRHICHNGGVSGRPAL